MSILALQGDTFMPSDTEIQKVVKSMREQHRTLEKVNEEMRRALETIESVLLYEDDTYGPKGVVMICTNCGNPYVDTRKSAVSGLCSLCIGS